MNITSRIDSSNKAIKKLALIKMINKSSLNKSTSKQLTTFARTERFSYYKTQPIDNSSNMERHKTENSKSSNRSSKLLPTIPKADRTFFFDQERQLCLNPSPQAYNVRHTDDIFKISHRGSTLGVRSYKKTQVTSPSAMDYNKQKSFSLKSFNKTFTFDRSQRTLMQVLNKRGKDSPGPIYNTQKSLLIDSPSLEKKRQIIRGEYHLKSNRQIVKGFPLRLNKFIVSHLQKQSKREKLKKERKQHTLKQNNKGFTTTFRKRIITSCEKNPGPGSYIAFSQFSGCI